jgi:hypothetical protein
MIWIYMTLFLCAVASGVWGGVVWTDYRVITLSQTHKRQMDEIFEELKRARAQVANLIGKE